VSAWEIRATYSCRGHAFLYSQRIDCMSF
jgi:hypothetical protein